MGVGPTVGVIPSNGAWGETPVQNPDIYDQSTLQNKGQGGSNSGPYGLVSSTTTLASDTATRAILGTALQAAIDALDLTAHNQIVVPAGAWTLDATVQLPRSITGSLTIRFNGAKVTLTSAARRLFDFHKIADHDTFQNINIFGPLTVDAANLGGQHHVVIGTYQGGTFQTRINVQDLTIKQVTVINAVVDETTTNHRLGIWIVPYQALAGEGTANYVRRVLIEDFKMTGGNMCCVIGGAVASGTSVGCNIYYDDIDIVRIYWNRGQDPTTACSSSGIQVGSHAQGGRVTIRGAHLIGSSDVGIEIDNPTQGLAEDVLAENCLGVNFLYAVFNNPLYPNEATMVFNRCHARQQITLPIAPVGWKISNFVSVALGTLSLTDCTYYRNTTQLLPNGGEGFSFGPAANIRKLAIKNFTTVWEGQSYTIGTSTLAQANHIGPFSVPAVVEIDGWHVRIAGHNSGGGIYQLDGLTIDGNTGGFPNDALFEVRNLSFDIDIPENTSAANRGLVLQNSSASMSGYIKGVACINMTGTNPVLIRINNNFGSSRGVVISEVTTAGMSASGWWSAVAAPVTLVPWHKTSTLTDGATVTPNPYLGDRLTLSAGAGRTIAAPSVVSDGMEFTLELLNNTGGAITTTWNAIYVFTNGAWTDPATTMKRQIRFRYSAALTKWVEQWRSSADF